MILHHAATDLEKAFIIGGVVAVVIMWLIFVWALYR